MTLHHIPGENDDRNRRVRPATKRVVKREPKPRYYSDETLIDFATVLGCERCERGNIPVRREQALGKAGVVSSTVHSAMAIVHIVGRGNYRACAASELWLELSKRFK